MPSLRDLDIVRRLNAPTRAAAARRRRLRKGLAAALLSCAALIAASGHASAPSTAAPPGSHPASTQLQGRQLVAIPVDDGLAGLLGQARVDVWAKNGTRLARAAPTAAPGTSASRGGFGAGPTSGTRALVGLTPESIASIAAHLERSGETWSDLFITLAP